jgi:anti-anti-sigma regulatory factor
MISTGDPLRDRFLKAVRAAIAAAPACAGLDELRDASQALLHSHTWLERAVADRDAQIAAHRSVITHLAFPVLQVSADTLCVPVFGELDSERAARLAEAVLAITLARGARNVVLDLTGALLNRDTPLHLVRVFQVLDRLGVRGALSGVGPEAAESLSYHPDLLDGVRCFTELSHALAALAPRMQVRRSG